jgi:hypothetical protein
MYCVPTGMLNIMGYIANHGKPAAMGGTGDWASQGEYHRVSGLDLLMGSLMGTSGANGTGGTGFYNGTVLWLLSHGQGGNFQVVHYYTSDTAGPSPLDMFIEMGVWGSLVAPVYGRYSFVGGDTGWSRGGGHCVTLYRVYNACGGAPNIGIKNPWTGDEESQYAQSAFESQSWDCIAETRLVQGRTRTMWRIGDTSDGKHRWIDELMVVRPLTCLTTSQGFGKIKIMQVSPLFTVHNPPLREIDSPNGAPIASVNPDLLFQNHWVVTAASGRVRPTLWKLDAPSGRFTSLLSFTSFVAADTDRFRHLIAICDGSVRKYDPTVNPPVLLQDDVPTRVPDALAISDLTGDIHTIDGATRMLRRYNAGNLDLPADAPLDTPIPLTGTPFLAINPADGALWMGSTGVNGAVYKLDLRRGPSGGPFWAQAGVASHGSMTSLTGMQFGDDGTLRLLSGGVVKCYRLDEGTGRWAPDRTAAFDGETGGGFIRVPTSRTNFDPLVHTGPGWDTNVPDPALDLPGGGLDCLADFNDDGFVDFFDYDAFVLCFESGRCPRGRDADVNEDGFEDFFDYDAYVQSFEGGC